MATINAIKDVYVSSTLCGSMYKTKNVKNNANIIVIGIVQKHIPILKRISYTLFLIFKYTCFFKIRDNINNIKNSHKKTAEKHIKNITAYATNIILPKTRAITGKYLP